MGQVSYGTITITDTNDIESIVIEYNRNQSTTTPPTQTDSGWSTTRPTWEQGYYIWQRTRIHKSGTSSDDDILGAAVCLTGSTGQSLSSTKTQYTNVASNVTITTSNHTSYNWADNVPTYNSSKPAYWARVTNIYANPTKTEYLVYKDNGITDAMSTAAAANTTARAANNNATEALSKTQAKYATSSTGATTQAKVAVFNPAVTTWSLFNGAEIFVKFTNKNNVANPTLSVKPSSSGSGTTAKTIRDSDGNALDSKFYWGDNSLVHFVYDGTYWRILDIVTTAKYNSMVSDIDGMSSTIGTHTTRLNGLDITIEDHETRIAHNTDDITLRATKTEAYQLAQPNLSPWFSYSPYKANDYWTTSSFINSMFTYTDMGDGWVRVQCTNSTSATVRSDPRPIRCESVRPNSDYTFLYEVRNNHSTASKNDSDIYVVQNNNSQFWGNDCKKNLEGELNNTSVKVKDLPQDSSTLYIKRFVKTSEPEGSSHWTGTVDALGAIVQRCAPGDIIDYELRISIYEGEYTGPYKPYSGTQLYASEAELKITNDNVLIKATKDDTTAAQGGQHLIQSLINVAPDGVTIDADKVNIEGAAIFKSGRLSSESLNNTYDPKGAADAIEIGGRNILRDSGTMTSWWKASRVTISDGVATLTGSSSNWDANLSTSKFDASVYDGAESVISFDYKSTVSCDIHRVYAGTNADKDSDAWSRTKYIGKTFTIPSSGGEWKRYVMPVTKISIASLTTGSGDVVSGYLQFYNRTDNGVFQMRHIKFEKGNKVTQWSPAPEDMVAQEQRIYYRTNTTDKPGAPATWVSSVDTANKKWTTKRMQYEKTYPYLFTCIQRQAIGGAITHTDVLLDDTTTVIDGGHIITGTVDANQIAANAVVADKIAANAVTANKIAANAVTAGKIATDAIHSRTYNSGTGIYSTEGMGIDLTGKGSIKSPNFAIDTEGNAYFKGELTATKLTIAPDATLDGDIDRLKGASFGWNLVRGTKNLIKGNGYWNTATWRISDSGGTVTFNQDITDSPVPSVNKGVTFTFTTTGTSVGICQDRCPIQKKQITQSVWVKGSVGDRVTINPIWSNTSGEEESDGKAFILADSNWTRLEYSKIPNYAHESVSLCYIYGQAATAGNVITICAPKLEYGSPASDWCMAEDEVHGDIGADSGNMLLDVYAPSTAKVNAAYDRYFSESGNSSTVCSFVPAGNEKLPDPNAKYFVRIKNTETGKARGFCFYNCSNKENAIGLIVGETYRVSCWVRQLTGSSNFTIYIGGDGGGTGETDTVFVPTSKWQKFERVFTFNDRNKTDGVWSRLYFYNEAGSNIAGAGTGIGAIDMCGFKLERINAITASGRNLCLRTADYNGWGKASNVAFDGNVMTFSKITTKKWRNAWQTVNIPYSVVRNQKITITYKIKAASGQIPCVIFSLGITNGETDTRLKYRNRYTYTIANGEWQTVAMSAYITDKIFGSTAASGTPDYDNGYFHILVGTPDYYLEAIQIKEIMVALGSDPCAWSPAPEDAQSDIDNVNETIGNVRIDLSTTQGDLSRVEGVANSAEGKAVVAYEVASKANDKTQELDGKYNAMYDIVNDYKTLKDYYITFNTNPDDENAGLVIGAKNTDGSNNAFKTQITNRELAFLQGDNKVASINSNQFNINQGVIESELRVGNFVIFDEDGALNIKYAPRS